MADKVGFDGSSDRISESIQVSRVLRPNPEEQAFHHYLTLGIEDTLQVHPLIKDIKMIIRPPVVPGAVIAWERKYKRKLPMDLKNYYYSTNGFRLTWNLDYGGELLRVGDMNINALSQLVPLEGSGKYAASKVASMKQAGSSGSIKEAKAPDYTSKSQIDEASTYLKISFGELQKMKSGSGCSATASGTTPTGSKYHSTPRSLVLPPHGQAFQLDSSKSTKGTVCIVFLEAAAQVSVSRQMHGTPKKKPSLFRIVDFKGASGGSHGSHYYHDLVEHKSESGPGVPGHDAASFNKSIDELEEEREVTNTESSFNSGGKLDNVQVWFLDPSFEWHFLAPTFSHYYKMLIYHLGLPEWEYRFTPYGMSPYAEQMFWIVAPHLLQPVKNHGAPQVHSNGDDNTWSMDYPPEVGKPNPVNNVINMNLFRKKKRDKKTTST